MRTVVLILMGMVQHNIDLFRSFTQKVSIPHRYGKTEELEQELVFCVAN